MDRFGPHLIGFPETNSLDQRTSQFLTPSASLLYFDGISVIQGSKCLETACHNHITSLQTRDDFDIGIPNDPGFNRSEDRLVVYHFENAFKFFRLLVKRLFLRVFLRRVFGSTNELPHLVDWKLADSQRLDWEI